MAPSQSASDSCILLVDPRKRHLDNLDHANQQHLAQRFQLLADGGAAASVPCYLVVEADGSDARDRIRISDSTNVYTIGLVGPAWSNSGVANALVALGKPNFVNCGFWLETKVLFLALCALSAGFDVSVLMDSHELLPPLLSGAIRTWSAPTLLAVVSVLA